MTDQPDTPDHAERALARLTKSHERGMTADARSRHIARAQVHAILHLADAIRPLTDALSQPLNTTPPDPQNPPQTT